MVPRPLEAHLDALKNHREKLPPCSSHLYSCSQDSTCILFPAHTRPQATSPTPIHLPIPTTCPETCTWSCSTLHSFQAPLFPSHLLARPQVPAEPSFLAPAHCNLPCVGSDRYGLIVSSRQHLVLASTTYWQFPLNVRT